MSCHRHTHTLCTKYYCKWTVASMDAVWKYPIRIKQLEFVSDHCFPNTIITAVIIVTIIIIIRVIINLSNMQTGFISSLRKPLFLLVPSTLLCYNLLLFPLFLLLLSFLLPVGLYNYLHVSSHFPIIFWGFNRVRTVTKDCRLDIGKHIVFLKTSGKVK